MTPAAIKLYALLNYGIITALLKTRLPFDTLVPLICPVFRFKTHLSGPEIHEILHPFIYKTVYGKHVWRPTCLKWSLLLFQMLKCFNHRAALNIGTRRADRGFDYHAWVEAEGIPTDRKSQSFKRLWRFE